MECFGPNPMLIEDGDLVEPSSHQQPPLVLIHDGSGLIFNYLLLPEFGRTVYGVYDPYFFSDKQWEGGFHELAEHYWDLIREEVPPGDIVLGGWSFGGIIALEMSLSLSLCPPEYTVTGIIMLDSMNPTTLLQTDGRNSNKSSNDHSTSRRAVPYTPKYDSHTSSTTRKCIANAIRRSEPLLETWNPPDWPSSAHSYRKRSSTSSLGRTTTDKLPPVILLRAMQYVPLDNNTRMDNNHDRPMFPSYPSSSNSNHPGQPPRQRPQYQRRSSSFLRRNHQRQQKQQQICTIDIARHSRTLGWDDVDPNFTQTVLDIPGHHYSIFAAENIDELSRQMRQALDILED